MESNSSKDEENPSKKQLKIMCDVIDQGQNTNPSATLADDVVEYIISFLPIKEASQTSILAKRFEKSWQHSKHLCFDFLLSRNYYQFQPVNIVHRVIMHHCSKKIETFKLCLNSNNIEYLINLWLVTVLHKEPKEVDLDFLMGKPYASPLQIPFEILDIKSIQILRISYCVVNLPSKFKGLHFLHSLILRQINLKRSFIKTIIDNCSLLEHLEIVQCHKIRQIKVDASALKFFKVLKILDCYQLGSVFVDARTMSNFHIDGNPRHVTFGEKIMFELRDVMLNCGRASLALNVPKLKKLMIDIAHVRVLTITSTLIEDLCAAFEIGKMKELKHGLWHVKELQVLMKATSICNPYDIIDFVDRCPILERLFIDMQSFSFQQTNQYLIMKEGFKFELHDKQLSFLKLVKFSNFNFSDSEIQLLKFFLIKVPNLENIAIFTSKNYCLKQYPFAVAEFLEFANSLRSTPTIKVGLYEYNDKEDGVIAPKHRPFSENYPY